MVGKLRMRRGSILWSRPVSDDPARSCDLGGMPVQLDRRIAAAQRLDPVLELGQFHGRPPEGERKYWRATPEFGHAE
jgi:hypothetical protein